MKQELMDAIQETPVIAAVKDDDGLQNALQNENIRVVFILYGDICNISTLVQRIHAAGKFAIVHVDLIAGLASKEVAVDFIRSQTEADGIISTRQQIGTVERALQIFLKLGLVEVLDSGTFYMSNIELLIGQSSTEAERKRAARLQNKALSAPRTNGGHLSDIRPPEIEIELEKEIEIKREIEKGRSARAYGRYQNVFLTDEEMADLQASFPTVWGQYIEKLSEYMASTGKRYQSHAATIRRWAGEDAKKAAPPTRNRDYSVKEDETV